ANCHFTLSHSESTLARNTRAGKRSLRQSRRVRWNTEAGLHVLQSSESFHPIDPARNQSGTDLLKARTLNSPVILQIEERCLQRIHFPSECRMALFVLSQGCFPRGEGSSQTRHQGIPYEAVHTSLRTAPLQTFRYGDS